MNIKTNKIWSTKLCLIKLHWKWAHPKFQLVWLEKSAFRHFNLLHLKTFEFFKKSWQARSEVIFTLIKDCHTKLSRSLSSFNFRSWKPFKPFSNSKLYFVWFDCLILHGRTSSSYRGCLQFFWFYKSNNVNIYRLTEHICRTHLLPSIQKY